MDVILRIGSDPASWAVAGGDYEGLVAQLSQATAPVVVAVTAPLAGQLVLSPKAAGSVVILQPPAGGTVEPFDWNPGQLKPGTPVVYLASPAGPGAATSRYAVSADVNEQTVVQDIVTAMSGGTKGPLTLPVDNPAGIGTLVVDGATLPFAVVGSVG